MKTSVRWRRTSSPRGCIPPRMPAASSACPTTKCTHCSHTVASDNFPSQLFDTFFILIVFQWRGAACTTVSRAAPLPPNVRTEHPVLPVTYFVCFAPKASLLSIYCSCVDGWLRVNASCPNCRTCEYASSACATALFPPARSSRLCPRLVNVACFSCSANVLVACTAMTSVSTEREGDEHV